MKIPEQPIKKINFVYKKKKTNFISLSESLSKTFKIQSKEIDLRKYLYIQVDKTQCFNKNAFEKSTRYCFYWSH